MFTDGLYKVWLFLADKFGTFIDWIADPANQLLGVILGSIIALIAAHISNKNSSEQAQLNNENSIALAKLQNKNDEATRQKNLRREKMEELYILVSQWGDLLTSKAISHMSAMNGDITYDDFLDSFIDDRQKSEFQLERLDLLTNVYAPDIGGQLDIAKEYLREKIRPIELDFKEHYKEYGCGYTGDERKEQMIAYSARVSAFEKLINHLRKQIAEKIKAEL